MPGHSQQAALARRFPDALLFTYPKTGHSLARDFKWLGNHRYGIVHIHGRDEAQLRQHAEEASALIGWTAPYAECLGAPAAHEPRSGQPSLISGA